MNLIPLPESAEEEVEEEEEEPGTPEKFSELCKRYAQNELPKLSWVEAREEMALLKDFVVPTLGELDRSEITVDSMVLLVSRSPSNLNALISLVARIFWTDIVSRKVARREDSGES